ncbi:MAG TPA: efflux RND transporter periplasmic adaptor subunit [Desulfuromonadales bacterium]|nr:efflux RND transporter periplasmic adaptor subunit [Desulfuromonadales bacterium]
MTNAGYISPALPAFGRAILAISLFSVLAGCGAKHKESSKKEVAAAPFVSGVQLETVTTSFRPETIDLMGTVRARTSAVVSARIPGTINLLKVREGDRVSKGQLLVQLDAQENQANAAVAVSAIDEAERALEEARSRKKLADTTFERYQKLFTEQAVTRQEFDGKQTERDLAAQAVSRAEARLKQTRSGAQAASVMAGYTKITAPLSGIITSKQADLGATVFPAQALMTIEDQGSYQLELAVPESLTPAVKPGTGVEVTLDALKATFHAKISEIVPAADAASRTFIAKIALTQKGITSGMFGRGSIALQSSAVGIFVTQKAIVERGSLTSVWSVGKDAVARMRLVKVGKAVGDRVEIQSGLSAGERIVSGGVEKVSEGSRVE